MNPYVILGSGTPDGLRFATRLTEWHDAMVAHERLLRSKGHHAPCSEDCPHEEAELLWSEAQYLFGSRAHELQYLRDKARPDSKQGGSASAIRQV